jgi:electron transfer flavoprotein beta subunit
LKVSEPFVTEPLTQVLKYELPKAHAACKFIDAEQPEQLVEMLQNEAKVI